MHHLCLVEFVSKYNIRASKKKKVLYVSLTTIDIVIWKTFVERNYFFSHLLEEMKQV